MSGAYVKVFGSMLNSSIWCTDVVTRIVWLTLLLLADADGCVWGAVPGIARQAGVEPEACRRSLDLLSAPDPDSRTPDEGGRRIVAVPGGWRIVNARKYREMQTNGQRLASERSKRYRERKAGVTPRDDRDESRDESRESRPEREEESERQVEGEGGRRRDDDGRPPNSRPEDAASCPDCHTKGSLRRSRQHDGWFCGTRLGGCDASFDLNDPAILAQLTTKSREAIERRVGKASLAAQATPPGAPRTLPLTAKDQRRRAALAAGITGGLKGDGTLPGIRTLEFDEEAEVLAAELDAWLATNQQPGEKPGTARARWYVHVKGIVVPSPAHMAVDRALDRALEGRA